MTSKSVQLMANALIQDGHHSVVVDEGKLSRRAEEDLPNTDLVIVGSSIVGGLWKGGPKKFLKKYGSRIHKLAVFVTAGGTFQKVLSEGGGKEGAVALAVNAYIDPLKKKYKFSTILDGAFGGKVGSGEKVKYDNWDAASVKEWIRELDAKATPPVRKPVVTEE
jgi:menaquinone-dependent protoporphyrinogen IX oxidase